MAAGWQGAGQAVGAGRAAVSPPAGKDPKMKLHCAESPLHHAISVQGSEEVRPNLCRTATSLRPPRKSAATFRNIPTNWRVHDATSV